MWLLHASSIFLQEYDIHICSSSLLQRMHFVNVVHESLLGLLKGFERSTSGWSSSDRLYLFNRALQTVVWLIFIYRWVFRFPFAIIPRSAGLALFYELLQLAFLDQFFYLLLQVFAILGVVAMVFMEMVNISSCLVHWVRNEWFWLLEVMIVLNLR